MTENPLRSLLRESGLTIPELSHLTGIDRSNLRKRAQGTLSMPVGERVLFGVLLDLHRSGRNIPRLLEKVQDEHLT